MARGLIYFVSWEDDLDNVKIGYTTGLQKRLSDFLVANWRYLVVRKVISAPNGKDDEALLHQQFAEHRIAGEWFHLHSSIVDLLEKESDALTWQAKDRLSLLRLKWDVITNPSDAFFVPVVPKDNIKKCRHYILWLLELCESDGVKLSPALLKDHAMNRGRFKIQTIYNEMQALRDREMIVKDETATYRLTLFGRKELLRFNNLNGREY